MADPLKFRFDIGSCRHVAIRKVSKVEFHAGLEAPFKWHLVDADGAFATVHRGCEMVRRIEVRTVVGDQVHAFDGPGLAVRKVGFLESRKETEQLRRGLLVIEVFDSRLERWRIGHHFVFQEDG